HGHDERRDRKDGDRRPAGDHEAEDEGGDRDPGGEEEQVAVGLGLEERADDAHGRLRVSERMLTQGCRRVRSAAMVPTGFSGWGYPPNVIVRLLFRARAPAA